ncbi:MarR family winged helix-turn-helix transcriptional regulator [Bacillus sp. EB600]|uniref:MarR family winged helix-turn-helix transcriptional regulator n=1 Tax=Bacillus sp. EB600 TaxID=2806345 RepID=UPI00210C5A64|nr:MarR family transcriptional regulator [Bacillus sp. EB600]MCQ6282715.1 MarR family transcriptional regulator [Bacillus sp. EB600]
MVEFNNQLLDSFSEINKAIYKLLKKEADQHGITVVQLKALYRISSSPNIGLGELSEKLRLTNSTVSGVIDRLVQHELVERVIPPENRRSVLIHLTDKGQELLEGIINEDSLIIKKIKYVMELPEEEIQHLMRLHRLVLSKLTIEEE